MSVDVSFTPGQNQNEQLGAIIADRLFRHVQPIGVPKVAEFRHKLLTLTILVDGVEIDENVVHDEQEKHEKEESEENAHRQLHKTDK